MFLAQEWHPNGQVKSVCTLGREGLTQYPQGVEVEVSADDDTPGCKVKLIIPEVVQGDVSLTRLTLEQRAAAMAEFLMLIRALAPQLGVLSGPVP